MIVVFCFSLWTPTDAAHHDQNHFHCCFHTGFCLPHARTPHTLLLSSPLLWFLPHFYLNLFCSSTTGTAHHADDCFHPLLPTLFCCFCCLFKWCWLLFVADIIFVADITVSDCCCCWIPSHCWLLVGQFTPLVLALTVIVVTATVIITGSGCISCLSNFWLYLGMSLLVHSLLSLMLLLLTNVK